MKRLNKAVAIGYFSVLMMVMSEIKAYAYIDPATTSYLIQILAGVLIAAGATLGIFWKKIRYYFKEQSIKRLEKKLTKEAEKKQKEAQ